MAGEDGKIFSTDDFWGEEYNFNFKLLSKAHQWNKDRVRDAMSQGIEKVVVDNTNTTKKEWHPYDQMAKQAGYKVEFAYPESKWWKELAPLIKNNSFTDEDVKVFYEKTVHGVPFETIKNMMTRFDFSEI